MAIKIKAAGGNQTALKTTSHIVKISKSNKLSQPACENLACSLSYGQLTLITATKPDIVTKEFSLNPEGVLCKNTTANISAGTMEAVKIKDLAGLSNLLPSLAPNQCLAYGVTGHEKINLVTENAWVAAGSPDDSMPRSAKLMKWSTRPGILMLDYDPPKDGNQKPLIREELVALLEKACPPLKEVEKLWWPSTSSNIYLGEKELSGLKGQRIYIIVKNATDIPRLGKVLNDLLWANGIGYFEVSKSGSLLERGLFDGSVWQTNRIDFAAGAKCHDGLEQRRGEPLLLPGKINVLDSQAIIPDPSPENLAQAEANKAKARSEKSEEAAKMRQEWIASRMGELLKDKPKMLKEHAEATVRRAVENHVLMGDWQILVMYGNDIKAFSVLHILDHPNEFHGLETLDPLEPDYDGRRLVGKLFIIGVRPCLHSMAHGGVKYNLRRQPTSIEVVKGKISETTDATIDVLRNNPDVFDFSTNVVMLGGNGKLLLLDQNSLCYVLSGMIQFYRRRITKNNVEVNFIDPPTSVCSKILSLHGVRGLKKLVAVITAPTLRPDGTVLSLVGYDATTGLLFDAVETPLAIPENPTKEQANAALERIWMPFSRFPFVSSLDRAVFLSALLTAVVRPGLSTAPGFGFDAPIQSSGKTLLASCIAIIATGVEPGIIPHVGSVSDEETRKRLFSTLRSGERVILLDNITGTFDSVSMAALLTSESYCDRILGQTEVASFPNRALVLYTGNNLTFGGDMSRRVLVCRIDPKTDQPYARKFDLNPAKYCLEHRGQIVADALTLIRFYLSSGVLPLGAGRVGSFEDWDSWVRQTVLYVDQALKPGFFGDVMEQIIVNQAVDPEQESLGRLLEAWHNIFGDEWQLTSKVIDVYRNVSIKNAECASLDEDTFVEAINDFSNSKEQLTTKSLGKLLKYRKDRIVDGMRLEQLQAGKNASRWRVVLLQTNPKNN